MELLPKIIQFIVALGLVTGCLKLISCQIKEEFENFQNTTEPELEEVEPLQ